MGHSGYTLGESLNNSYLTRNAYIHILMPDKWKIMHQKYCSRKYASLYTVHKEGATALLITMKPKRQ